MKNSLLYLLILSPLFLFAQTETKEDKSLTILFTIIIIVTTYFILKKVKPDSVAINTKRVICPICKTKQPIIRIPKNSRQVLWGGTTCPKCETELDKFGNIIKKQT